MLRELVVALFLIHEAYLDGHLMPAGVARPSLEINKDGNALPPTGVGVGEEVDETQFAKVNADPKRQFKWPHPTYQDGSVRDY